MTYYSNYTGTGESQTALHAKTFGGLLCDVNDMNAIFDRLCFTHTDTGDTCELRLTTSRHGAAIIIGDSRLEFLPVRGRFGQYSNTTER